MSGTDKEGVADDGSNGAIDQFLASLMEGMKWSNHLRNVNRHFLPETHSETLNRMIDSIDKQTNRPDLTNAIFFRARKHIDQITAYSGNEMGAPPATAAKAGRINPDGIPCLYLSDSVDTAISENRPWRGAKLSVAGFKLLKNHKLAYLRRSELVTHANGICQKAKENKTTIVIPIDLVTAFSFMATSFAKPLGTEQPLEYVPTQYFSSLLKHRGYEGIVYDSMMHTDGYNVALFDPQNAVQLVGKVEVYYVKDCVFTANKEL